MTDITNHAWARTNFIWWTSELDLMVMSSQIETFGVNVPGRSCPTAWPAYLQRAMSLRMAYQGTFIKGKIYMDSEFGQDQVIDLINYSGYSPVVLGANGYMGNNQGLSGVIVKPEDLRFVRDLPGLLSNADLLNLRWIGPTEIWLFFGN